MSGRVLTMECLWAPQWMECPPARLVRSMVPDNRPPGPIPCHDIDARYRLPGTLAGASVSMPTRFGHNRWDQTSRWEGPRMDNPSRRIAILQRRFGKKSRCWTHSQCQDKKEKETS